MTNTHIMYHSTLTIQHSIFFCWPRKSLRILKPTLRAATMNTSEPACSLENYSPSLPHLCFWISVSHEYHEVGKDGLNQIGCFQKSRNGSSQTEPRLQIDFVSPNSIVIFFFFNNRLPTLKHQEIWYKYSDFCLSFKDQVWRHWTFIATFHQLAGSENRLFRLLWVLLIQISLFTRWISNAHPFLAPLWL